MAKLKPDPITAADMEEFVQGTSDFAFEIRTLKALTDMGLTCDHGGTYDDPATNKPRQFDIRAVATPSGFTIRFAVECKNLQLNAPVLISCLPRRSEESFHDVMMSIDVHQNSLVPAKDRMHNTAFHPSAKNVRLSGRYSIYNEGQPVGKCCDQVGREISGNLSSNDADVYDKWSQAIASSLDLVKESATEADRRKVAACYSLVLPILVVPEGMLWRTLYDHRGACSSPPTKTDRCSFFINKSFFVKRDLIGTGYSISHLEFVTPSGLTGLIGNMILGNLGSVFPLNVIRSQYNAYIETGIENNGAM